MRLLERTILIMVLGTGFAQADPIDLKPFRASYTIEWKGITAANSTLELKQAGSDSYTYSTEAAARGMFRLAFSDTISQASTFRVANGKVIPLSFRGQDEKERPIELNFDWTRKRVTGVAKELPVDLEVPEGTQDAMSLQIASLRNLASGNLQDKVTIVDADKLKEYELRREGTAQIETALGQLETVIYSSTRGDRLTRTWVAPALGYLPVKAERQRKSKVEFTLLIQSIDK